LITQQLAVRLLRQRRFKGLGITGLALIIFECLDAAEICSALKCASRKISISTQPTEWRPTKWQRIYEHIQQLRNDAVGTIVYRS
jgi:hypothetical protein